MIRLREHTVVRTIKYVYKGDTILPRMSVGTIVHSYPVGYLVEFLLRKKAFEAECDIPCPESVVVYCPEGSIEPTKGKTPTMKTEVQIAHELHSKGYRHVVQFQTNGVNFGEPLFLKTIEMASEMLNSFKTHENATIAWSKTVEEYIDDLA